MKEIIIEPHIGIGQLKLGMTSDELENALLQMKKQWSNSSDEAMQMECCLGRPWETAYSSLCL